MKKIIIIGAGISGLSTGCYAQITGFTSEIFEMHTIPGGVCTSWKRGDYLFDHCLHWVIGSNKGTNLYPIFKDLGISENIDFYHTDIFRVILSANSACLASNVRNRSALNSDAAATCMISRDRHPMAAEKSV